MESNLDRDALRSRLAALDERQKKIAGGLMAVMFKNSERVRDREWISEQFVQVALLAGEMADVDAVRDYAQQNIGPVLDACYLLFKTVGEDLAPRAETGFTHADAVLAALAYFGARESPPLVGESAEAD